MTETAHHAPTAMLGLVVVDPLGHRVGEVDGIVEGSDGRWLLVVGSGGLPGFGRVHRLVPGEMVVETSDRVLIRASHTTVHDTARYDFDVRPDLRALYRHYGWESDRARGGPSAEQ